MSATECEGIKVDVPVGFLLPETRELLVSVDRVDEGPLSIRLRLIPAVTCDATIDIGASPRRTPDDTPAPRRRLTRKVASDGYPDYEYGGSD